MLVGLGVRLKMLIMLMQLRGFGSPKLKEKKQFEFLEKYLLDVPPTANKLLFEPVVMTPATTASVHLISPHSPFKVGPGLSAVAHIIAHFARLFLTSN